MQGPGRLVVPLQEQVDDSAPGGESEGDLVSQLGTELEVTLDRWSLGHLGADDLIAAAVVLVVGVLLAWVVKRVAHRVSAKSDSLAQGAIEVAGRLIGVIIILVSVAVGLEILGFSLGPILVLLVASVVALLIMRPVITNLSTGLLLQARGPFRVGDLVLTNEVRGVVEEINSRTVVLAAPDGRRLHLPNTSVLDGTIENYTAEGHLRSAVELTIKNAADVEDALAVMATSLSEAASILPSPPSEVSIKRVDGHQVVLEGLFWHAPTLAEGRQSRTDAARAILAAFAEAEIELGYPRALVSLHQQANAASAEEH